MSRYLRHELLPEVGADGQRRIEAHRVDLRGDPTAVEVARTYLERAGVQTGGGPPEEVGAALTERPELRVAAAWLGGAWHAVETLKRAVGAGRPAPVPDISLDGPPAK